MTKYLFSPNRNHSGFTLAELSIVLVIVALLISGMLVPLSAQKDIQSVNETQKKLFEAKEALLGFVAANGRLPCPASSTSNGVESFCTNEIGDICETIVVPPTLPRPDHGRCSNPYDGLLPSVTLGLSEVDANGYLTDGWGFSTSSRIRYAVYSSLNTIAGKVGSVVHPFTAKDGIRSATMSSISDRTPLLSVCSAASGVGTTTCSLATKLTDSAAAVIFSLGKNASTGGSGDDEAENTDGDSVFVSHTQTAAGSAGGEFDDAITWLSPNILFNRMIVAEILP